MEEITRRFKIAVPWLGGGSLLIGISLGIAHSVSGMTCGGDCKLLILELSLVSIMALAGSVLCLTTAGVIIFNGKMPK